MEEDLGKIREINELAREGKVVFLMRRQTEEPEKSATWTGVGALVLLVVLIAIGAMLGRYWYEMLQEGMSLNA